MQGNTGAFIALGVLFASFAWVLTALCLRALDE